MKIKSTIRYFVAMALALIMVISMMSCVVTDIGDVDGDTDGDMKDVVPNDPDEIPNDNDETNTEPSDDNNESDTETPDNNESDTQAPDDNTEENTPAESLATIEERVLFEYYGLVVTAKKIVEDSIWGTGIKVNIENNSDNDYSIGIEQAIVNNCMITDFFSCTVAAGKKANETIYLSASNLQESGISNIGQVELYFYLYDSNTYERIYETDCITIRTSHYDCMDTTVENAGTVLYEDDGVKIMGKYVDEYQLLGKAIVLQIINDRDENIGVSCQDMSINGYMVTPLFYSTVYSGKFAIDEITILSSDLEENDIVEIDEFALKFEIYNVDTYDTIIITDELSFSVK